MLRKLLIVFASGVILSILAFGLAWVVGGEKLHKQLADGNGWTLTIGDDDHNGPRKERSFAIEPGARLAMELPVDLSFTRGDKTEMIVSGPAAVVDKLVWQNGRLSLPGGIHMRHGVKVRITAPEITGLDLDAPADVKLKGLQQDRFALNSRGPVDLEAEGKVRQLFVTVAGPGDVDLGKVEGQDATVRVDGVGDVTLGATGTVDVEINGVGNVSLVRKPRVLRSGIHGLGSIDRNY